MIRSRTKTAIKKVHVAIKGGDKSVASAELIKAVSVIDKAANKGIYHKNNAARKKSRLYAAVNKMSA
jgi:small subunit ribosomal protein S20